MAAYVPKLTALNDIHDHASKSAIPPPVGLVHLGHDISDCASKVRVYLQTGKIHAGYLRMSGDCELAKKSEQGIRTDWSCDECQGLVILVRSLQASFKRKSIHMITRRIAIFAALSVTFYPILPALPASDPDLLAGLDTDNDGTVSLDEAKKAAEAMFDKIDRDHDGTLTRRELRGRLSAKEFAAADTDKDGTLSKDEYLDVVGQRFKAADADNDGTLTRRELRSRAGRQLLLLLR